MTLEEQRRPMLAGKMYNDLTPELIQQGNRRCFSPMNTMPASVSTGRREAILSQLFKSVGHGAHFEPTSLRIRFTSHCENFYATRLRHARWRRMKSHMG